MEKHKHRRLYSLVSMVALVCLAATSVGASVYYVSPTGDDSADGSSTATAWRSIDNGDALGIIAPGDTIRVLPGTYYRTSTIQLNTSGLSGQPIVYQGYLKSRPVVNLNNAGNPAFTVSGRHTTLDGFEITNANADAIRLQGDSCTISHCLIYNVSGIGIVISSSDNLIYRNVVYEVGGRGILNENAGQFGNRYYHNVVSSSGGNGIELQDSVTSARLFNNIVVQNNTYGIVGPAGVVCGFNNVWGNTGGNYVGVVDSAGGIAKLPKFVDASAHRFDLQDIAFEIDAGLDLGFPYSGAAPDIGAIEKYKTYYVSENGDDNADGESVATAWRTIDNGDSLLLPGDTVYVLPGTYTAPVVITDSGLDLADQIWIKGVRDSTFVDASGVPEGVTISGSNIYWSGITVTGASADNFYVSGTNVTIQDSRILNAGTYGVNSVLPVNLTADVISGSGSAGFYCAGGTGGFIYNNTFYDNGDYGCWLNATGVTLTNNIFDGHAVAGVQADATSNLTYCLFYNNALNVQGGVTAGYGCVFADPLLVDPAGGQFQLQTNSPAIDAGYNIGLPYSGAAPDLGAYEATIATSITIIPVRDTLRADSSYQFSFVAVDNNGNPAGTGQLIWSHTFSDGTIDSTGQFTPQSVGTGQIILTAPDLGLADTTNIMVVVPGDLASLSIQPMRDTLSTDSTRQFTTVGSDIRGNTVVSLGNLTWQVLGGVGLIDTSGLFDPTTVGVGFVQVTSDLGVSALSDSIFVVPGQTASIQVTPEQNIQGHNESFQYHAFGYDADSNVTRELTDSVTWSVTDTLGSITAGGVYTSNLSVDGTYYVVADYGSFRDSAEVIVTNQLSRIQIELEDGTPLGDTTLSTDVDTTRLFCRAYTSLNVLIGEVAVDWSLVGTGSIGSLSNSFGSTSTLLLTTPGTGQIVVSDSLGRADTSGVITCVAGAPARFDVQPTTATVSADSTLAFTAQSLDADGNPTSPRVLPSWFVLGGIGTISVGGTFTPSVPGTGSVVCVGGGISDTVGPITVVPGALVDIAVSPDSVVLSADTGRQFTVVGHDAHGNVADVGTITWGLTAPLGSIDSSGYFDAATVGTGRVIATSSLGPTDTSAFLQVLAGRLVQLIIAPDSANTTTDSSVTFSAQGFDADGNATPTGQLTWQVIGGIGDISSFGEFTPLVVGTGQVAVINTVENVADTNTAVVVRPGQLARLAISPDTATLRVGDTLVFTATGYDATFNQTDVGVLTWTVSGGIGSISSTGVLTAVAPGIGRVAAVSDINGVTDSTGSITVEALNVSTIPIGNQMVHPGDPAAPLLAFRVDNFFASAKSIQSVTVRDALRGAGTATQQRSNLSGLSLYLDRDADSILSAADSLMAQTTLNDSLATFNFTPITIEGDSGRDFIVAGAVSLVARDGDSLDLSLRPATDVETSDGTTVVGPGSVNSLGYAMVDGMMAAQISVAPTGTTVLSPGTMPGNVMTFDLPRNGYTTDTLSSVNLVNMGTATASDIGRMALYVDNGDGTWDGAGAETYLGDFNFTGALWGLTGLTQVLSGSITRFFVAVQPAEFPTGGVTVALAIPTGGITVRSGDDGPLDEAVPAVDTIPIQTFQSIAVSGATIARRPVHPGEATGPMFGVKLTNSYGTAVGLDSLTLRVAAVDPNGATQAELDSQIDSVLLYLNRDGDYAHFGTDDSLIAVGSVTNGLVHLDPAGLTIPPDGGSVELSVGLHLTALARDGNTLALQLTDSTDLSFNIPAAVTGSFPVMSGSPWAIQAFTTAQVTDHAIGDATLPGGRDNYAVLDFELPSNGYAVDTLKSIRIENIGNFSGPSDILTFKLWAESGTPGYSADDSLLGTFGVTAQGWALAGLTQPVPVGGLRFYVTVSIASVAFDAGTIQMRIPTGGVVYRSGTDGPDDGVVTNPGVQLIVPSNRITAISVPTVSIPVAPGSSRNQVLTFAMYNGYVGHDQTLKSIALTNISLSQSGPDYADSELGQVSLYFDVDNDRLLDNDSLVALGTFVNGRLSLNGLDILLPAESLSYFFVVADFPTNQIDGDSLAVAVASAADFVFADPVSINGDMPLSGGNYLVVDGSVRRQYQLLSLAPRTLSPLDSAVTLMAFHPARDGDQTDTLEAVTIGNAGSATNADISRITLWLDRNGDNIRQDTDSLLGTMNYTNGRWSLTGLGIEVADPPPTLFAAADIAAGATPDASFQGVIPTNGCTYRSANDGPNDSAVVDYNVYTISNSALQVAYQPMPATYSVGQAIDVRFWVTNISDSILTGVTGAVVGLADSALVTFQGSSVGPVTLGPGDSTEFVFSYTALAVGDEAWRFRAYAPADTSAEITTNTTAIQQMPTAADVGLVNSIPTAVTRGQENVFPLSLVFRHPDTTNAAAALALDSLVLTVENGSGGGVNADAVFRRMVLSTGTATLAVIDSVPSTSAVMVRFTQPLLVPPGQERRVSLLVDIDSAATASQFALAISSANALPFVDANSSTPVPIYAPAGFPLRTASCRIDDPSRQLAVGYDPLLGTAVNVGQRGVVIAQLNFRHPGQSGSSQIQLSGLSMRFVDAAMNLLPFDALFDEIDIVRQQTIVGSVTFVPSGSTTVAIPLSSPLTLNPGEKDSVSVVASIRNNVAATSFAMLIADSTEFAVRDLSSGSELTAVSDTAGLATGGSVFPILTGAAYFRQPAAEAEVCPSAIVPTTVIEGVDSLGLFDLVFSYPYDTSYSPVRVSAVTVNVLDSLGSPLDPERLFDQIGCRIDGGAVRYQPAVDLLGGGALFHLGDTGVVVGPGQSPVVRLVADIRANAPFDHFVLQLPSGASFGTRDATDTTKSPGVQLAVGCTATFPYSGPITEVLFPAGRPTFSPVSRPVQVAYAGQTGVVLLESGLSYLSDVPQGPLGLTGVTGRLRRDDGAGGVPCKASDVITNARVLIDTVAVPGTMTLSGDSVVIAFNNPYQVASNDMFEARLAVDLAAGAPYGNYYLRFADSTFLSLKDLNDDTTVYASLNGSTYPVKSTEISLTAPSLGNSFSNYPNPFNPATDGHTTIAYVLDQDATIDIEIFTITGEKVRDLVVNASRAAGSHQEDIWDGVNGTGHTVMPGTYFCRITARYASGREESFRRKIAVVR